MRRQSGRLGDVGVVVAADSVLAVEDSVAPVRMSCPATYTVALVQGGKVIDSKPLKVGFDPDVRFAAGEHERYNAIVTDLHAIQRRGTEAAGALNKLYPQMADVAKKVGENASVPALVKTQFESLNKDLDALRKKFGVPLNAPAAAGRGGGGGGGRGGAVDPDNVLARTSGLKTQIDGNLGDAERVDGTAVQRGQARVAESRRGRERAPRSRDRGSVSR